jgi:nicotinamide riboside kinase
MTLIVNLFGPPSAGKTTVAHGMLYKLKCAGISCEYAPEYAKELVWRQDDARLADQYSILEEQVSRIVTYVNKVDVVVTDGPILLTSFYNNKYWPNVHSDMDVTTLEQYYRFKNLNFFIERSHAYESRGRYQTDEESFAIQDELKAFLGVRQVPYTLMKNTDHHIDSMVMITKMEI